MGWGRGYTVGKYRLHRQPRLFARALAAELAIASGQLFVDRTFTGVPARVVGFSTGLRTAPEALPPLPEIAERVTLREALGCRLRRRGPGPSGASQQAAVERARGER